MERLAKEVQQLDQTLCPALGIMQEFYVRLGSGVSKREFPQNKSSSFRNRLPDPIRFTKPRWKVRLTSLHVPAKKHMGVIIPCLFEIAWHEDHDPDNRGYLTKNSVKIKSTDLVPFHDGIRTGTDLMNTVRHLY